MIWYDCMCSSSFSKCLLPLFWKWSVSFEIVWLSCVPCSLLERTFDSIPASYWFMIITPRIAFNIRSIISYDGYVCIKIWSSNVAKVLVLIVERIWGYCQSFSKSWTCAIDFEVWWVASPLNICCIWYFYHPIYLWALWPYSGTPFKIFYLFNNEFVISLIFYGSLRTLMNSDL